MACIGSLPGGGRRLPVRGGDCALVALLCRASPQIHITRVVVSQCPCCLSVRPFVRNYVFQLCIEIRPRFPACSICKPPRNESVNPVTSFAAILALRRRRYSHFPPNPPACLRLRCKSVETPIHRRRRRRIVPAVRSGPMQIRSPAPIIAGVSALSACYILVIYALSVSRVYGFHGRISRSRSLRTSC